MKEIVINQNNDILIKDIITQRKNPDNHFLVRTDFCLIEIPIELKLDDSEEREGKIAKRESRLAVSNCAKVEDVSSLISGIIPGDRVASGADSVTGDYFLKKDAVVKLSEGIGGEKACFIGFGASALGAIRKANLELGHKVAVFGQGLSGALTAQIARESGAEVAAIDADEDRLNIAEQSGIMGIDFSKADFLDKLKEFSRGIGVDIVFITAKITSKNLWEHAWRMLRPEGTIVITQAQDINFDHRLLGEKNINIRVCLGYKMWKDYFPADNIIHPIGYVRWDLKRDLEEIKNMIINGGISTNRLISRRIRVERSDEPLIALSGQDNDKVGILLGFS